MAKKVLIISSSLRAGSNSEILARECEKGAKAAGHEVEFISLKGREIKFCIGCLSCQKTGSCVLRDDVPEMSGQLKTLLDRLNPLYAVDYAFREIYMIATAAEDGDTTFDKAYHGLQGWVDCFEQAELTGIVAGGGIDAAQAAISHDDVMKKAYRLGFEL